MKSVKYLWGMSLLLLVGCSDAFNNGDINKYTPGTKQHYLYVSDKSVELDGGKGATKTIGVKAAETPWKLSGTAQWLSVDPTSGSSDASVRFTANETNPWGDEMRTSIFNLAATEPDVTFNYTISATQRPARPYLDLSATRLTFPAAQSSQTVRVNSNAHWKMSDISALGWLTAAVAADSSAITFSVSENAAYSGHEAYLNFYDKNYSTLLNTLIINQLVPESPNFSTSLLELGSSGGAYSLSLTSQVAWTAEASASWLQVSPQSGAAGTTELTVTVLPNMTASERAGHVYVKVANQRVADLVIKQKGFYLEVAPTSVTFPADGEARELAVGSNTAWAVLSKPDWITLSSTEGKGDGTITLKADSHWALSGRSGVLKMGIVGTDVQVSVLLIQEGRRFEDFAETLLYFASSADAKTVSLATDGHWQASVDAEAASWITVSPVAGTGQSDLEITVADNPSDSERMGFVYVTVDTKTQTIAVVQRGKYFTVMPSTMYELPAQGGGHMVEIVTDDSWTAYSTSSWMHLSQASGEGNFSVVLAASANNSIFARTDTTFFIPSSSRPVKILTRQAGHYMTVDAASVRFFAKGGTSDAIHVTSDVAFEYSLSGDDWFTVTRVDNALTVTATQNNTGERREGRIILTLTNLLEGESYVIEIPVYQMESTYGMEVIPFPSDQQWEVGSDGQTTIRVTGFSDDKDLDDASQGGVLVIKITAFPSDKNWD